MTTVISPNLIHTRDRIDPSGNIINPKTKQIIQPVQEEYVPPENPTIPETAQAPVSKIDEMINKLVESKIEEMVAKKVEEALSKL